MSKKTTRFLSSLWVVSGWESIIQAQQLKTCLIGASFREGKSTRCCGSLWTYTISNDIWIHHILPYCSYRTWSSLLTCSKDFCQIVSQILEPIKSSIAKCQQKDMASCVELASQDLMFATYLFMDSSILCSADPSSVLVEIAIKSPDHMRAFLRMSNNCNEMALLIGKFQNQKELSKAFKVYFNFMLPLFSQEGFSVISRKSPTLAKLVIKQSSKYLNKNELISILTYWKQYLKKLFGVDMLLQYKFTTSEIGKLFAHPQIGNQCMKQMVRVFNELLISKCNSKESMLTITNSILKNGIYSLVKELNTTRNEFYTTADLITLNIHTLTVFEKFYLKYFIYELCKDSFETFQFLIKEIPSCKQLLTFEMISEMGKKKEFRGVIKTFFFENSLH